MTNTANIQKAYEELTEAVSRNDEAGYQRAKRAFVEAALDKAMSGKLFYVDYDNQLKAVIRGGGKKQ